MEETKGIYIVTLNNDEPISVNSNDKRIAHKCLKANRSYCKFGKTENLRKRKNDYYKVFGKENVNFKPILSATEIFAIEKLLKNKLDIYRAISPLKRKTEWLQGIKGKELENLIIHTLENSDYQWSKYEN